MVKWIPFVITKKDIADAIFKRYTIRKLYCLATSHQKNHEGAQRTIWLKFKILDEYKLQIEYLTILI